jgi:nicotinamide mononucleotide adenylyltransferase
MKYKIVSIDSLVPLEKVFPTHLKNLEDMLDADGFMLKAIIVDEKNGIVLDGSHRYVYLLKKGFKTAPVYLVNYDNEDIRVGTRLGHRFLIDGDSGISKEECRRRALGGNLFSPRTTRHFFTFRKADISLPLNRLKKGKPVDVSNLISDVEVFDEIDHNKKYIEEINEEMEIIIQYLSEVSQTKEYLTNQIELMNQSRKVAFFPGKFHPPHIGHIQTILTILPKYRKVIIGVSEHSPKNTIITEPDKIVGALRPFFADFKNVEVCKIKGVLTEKKDLEGLPNFDVLLSGNPEVLSWAKKMNINIEYVPRSEGILFSGHEIRSILGAW